MIRAECQFYLVASTVRKRYPVAFPRVHFLVGCPLAEAQRAAPVLVTAHDGSFYVFNVPWGACIDGLGHDHADAITFIYIPFIILALLFSLSRPLGRNSDRE